jgi:hypothetical protein
MGLHAVTRTSSILHAAFETSLKPTGANSGHFLANDDMASFPEPPVYSHLHRLVGEVKNYWQVG